MVFLMVQIIQLKIVETVLTTWFFCDFVSSHFPRISFLSNKFQSLCTNGFVCDKNRLALFRQYKKRIVKVTTNLFSWTFPASRCSQKTVANNPVNDYVILSQALLLNCLHLPQIFVLDVAESTITKPHQLEQFVS